VTTFGSDRPPLASVQQTADPQIFFMEIAWFEVLRAWDFRRGLAREGHIGGKRYVAELMKLSAAF